ncbi:NAD-binding protein [Enterococcus wangshanyuanii]|uniref:NAD-binding protein n=2 Tax=Enterococcus wangshanyuanii TaxID=2005703 RepID=A0ABQ1PFV0_9ENTE|nr:NAD-binding protein [Enterococcus wangshanyuanii]
MILMNIVIFGGSGFIGTALCKELIQHKHTVTSISRHGRPNTLTEEWANDVHWVHSDILNDTIWQSAVINADWVIDAIGILTEKPNKGITYERFIVEPVQRISTFLTAQVQPANFLFLSANAAPFPLKKYMSAKHKAEQVIHEQGFPYTIIYPSLIMDKQRPTSVIGGKTILCFKKLPIFKYFVREYDPITREQLAMEITNLVEGKRSFLTERR